MASTGYNRSWRCRFVLLEYLRKRLPGSASPEPKQRIGQRLLVMFRKVPSRYLVIRTERPQTCWELAWPTVALLQPPHLDWRSRANWPLFRPDQSLRHSPRSVFGRIRLLPSPCSGRRRINGVLKHGCPAPVERARGCTCDGHRLFLRLSLGRRHYRVVLHNMDDPRVAAGCTVLCIHQGIPPLQRSHVDHPRRNERALASNPGGRHQAASSAMSSCSSSAISASNSLSSSTSMEDAAALGAGASGAGSAGPGTSKRPGRLGGAGAFVSSSEGRSDAQNRTFGRAEIWSRLKSGAQPISGPGRCVSYRIAKRRTPHVAVASH
jgi:hypothetical protein